MDNFAMVVSPAGEEKETLRLLLNLADRPRHVRIDHDTPGTYLVPEYLVVRYHNAATHLQAPAPEEAPEEGPEEAPGEEASLAPKRRGRPPGSRNRTPQAADDKDGEE